MSDPTQKSVSFPILPTPNDKRPLPEIIADYCGFPLTYVDHEDGKRYYAVQDWIVGVAQAINPRRFWSDLKRLSKANGYELYDSIVQLPYEAKNNKRYKLDFVTANGLYRITQRMRAETGIRDHVLKYLSKAGVVVDEIRIDPDKAFDLVIEAYKRQGKSEKWIATRIMSRVQRLIFTSTFQKSLRKPPQQWQYAVITDEIRLGLWKRKTSQIKQQRGLKEKDNLRDHLSIVALSYETIVEGLSVYDLERRNNLAFDESKQIVRSRADFVGRQADETSRELGIDIATDRPLLDQ